MVFYNYIKACPHSSMDRVLACGAIDGSSNLPGGTIIALKLKIPFDKLKGIFSLFLFLFSWLLGGGFLFS